MSLPLSSFFSCSVGRRTRIGAFSEKGYFSQADPEAEIRPLRKKREFDVTKREGIADFIWNTDWQSQLEQEAEDKRMAQEAAEKQKEAPSGFLSLARTANLDDLSVDLSAQLQPKRTQTMAAKAVAASSSAYVPPTQKEAVDWARGTKFATRAVAADLDAESQRSVEDDMLKYNQENSEILLWNAALSGISFSATYLFYTQDVAFSYLVGAVGGWLYLRLLKKGVEGIGSGGIGALASQPRLLVPVVLVMAFNRWNVLAADAVGVHLKLLPMLVGFFTYKAAVVGRQSVTLFTAMVSDMKGETKD